MHLSEFLVKCAKQLAGRAADFPIDTVEGAKILEQIRSSLWPQPVMIDHRSIGLHVNVQKGISQEALDKIEALAKIISGWPNEQGLTWQRLGDMIVDFI